MTFNTDSRHNEHARPSKGQGLAPTSNALNSEYDEKANP